MGYLFLAVAFMLNAAANILLKIGASRGVTFSEFSFSTIVANWYFVLGFALFAANVPFYFLSLRALPLSFAYPVMVAMGFLIVNAYALFALGESIGVRDVIGYAAIIIGVVLIASKV